MGPVPSLVFAKAFGSSERGSWGGWGGGGLKNLHIRHNYYGGEASIYNEHYK